MTSPSAPRSNHSLDTASHGRKHAARDLLPVMYDELRRLASRRMAGEAAGQTLQTTALVHEAYLRVAGREDPGWDGRGHFFAAAARAMRRILVEQARRKSRDRHGGGHARIELSDVDLPIERPMENVLAVDQAVRKLEAEDPRKARIVELRYFAGLSTRETATAMSLAVGTIAREWKFIRVWLQRELASGNEA